MTALQIAAFFTERGEPKTGLIPTIRIRKIIDGSLLISDESMTELGDGFYKYAFAGYDGNTDYAIRADGGATLNDTDRYKFSTNELDVSVGGGLGITGDMLFDLKKIADNVITREDLKKLLEQINKKINKVKELVKISNIKKEVTAFSKTLEAKTKMLIQEVVNGNNSNAEIKKTLLNLQTLQKEVDEILKQNKGQLQTMAKFNIDIKQDLDTDLSKIHKGLNQNMGDMSSLRQDIDTLSQNNKDELSKFNKLFSSSIDTISTELSAKVDNLKEAQGDKISKMSLLSQNLEMNKQDLQDSKKQVDEIIDQLKISLDKSSISQLINIETDINGITKEIKSLNLKALSSRDINTISVDLGDKITTLNKKLSDIGNSTKNQLIEISKKTKRRDDLPDVMAQMALLDKGKDEIA